jgi:sulfur carrier protein ThiS
MNNENKSDSAKLVVSQTPVAAATISINVGVPGNIRKVVLEGNRQWTVADALRAAEFDASGYEIRMGGEPVQANMPVTDGRTILLLRPVRGN